MTDAPTIPPHLEETIAAITELHTAHYRDAAVAQRFVSQTTDAIARPWSLTGATVAVAAWIALNLVLPRFGLPAFDPYPFPLLSVAASVAALYFTLFILIAQRHDDDLSTRRDQLTLEIAILAEQKSAKTIALLEEVRRESPGLANRRDETLEAMSTPADPHVVLEAIKAAHQGASEPPTGEERK